MGFLDWKYRPNEAEQPTEKKQKAPVEVEEKPEGFASKNGVVASALDGFFQGIGYTAALVLICIIRELLGAGTFGGGLLGGGEGIRIIPEGYPAMLAIMPVGGFLVLGFVLAGSQWLTAHMDKKNKKKEAAK